METVLDSKSGPRRTVDQKKLTSITVDGGWFDFKWGELWEARELILRFVHRDFVTSYKQTVLGPFWFIAPPLFTTLVFTLIFGKVADLTTDGAPQFLFYMSGVILWNYFSNCLMRTSNTFSGNSGIFGKVYFPRLVVPISNVITNLLTLIVQVVLFFVFYVWAIYNPHGAHFAPNAWVLLLPLLPVMLAMLGLGFGCIVSALTTYYRDLAMMLSFGVQLWMYASCVVYPLSKVPPEWQWVVALNPIVPVIETVRYACFSTGSLYPGYLLLSAVTSLMVFFIGLLIFKRMERNFMDTV